MDPDTKNRLEAAGFSVEADPHQWLGLTEPEKRMVNLRLAIARATRRLREAKNLSQADVAERIGSSQSRVAKVESAATGVSLDLSFKVLFALGGQIGDVQPVPRA